MGVAFFLAGDVKKDVLPLGVDVDGSAGPPQALVSLASSAPVGVGGPVVYAQVGFGLNDIAANFFPAGLIIKGAADQIPADLAGGPAGEKIPVVHCLINLSN